MSFTKIVPSLWFHTTGGSLAIVTEYYKNIFNENFKVGNIMPLGETPSGNTELTEVQIFGQKYSFMSTANEHQPFNDAFALTINCEDQNEIDLFWNYFIKEGKEVQCGWCVDKFGLRWQVIPKNLGELMSKPNAWQVMMQQKKIVIAEYLN